MLLFLPLRLLSHLPAREQHYFVFEARAVQPFWLVYCWPYGFIRPYHWGRKFPCPIGCFTANYRSHEWAPTNYKGWISDPFFLEGDKGMHCFRFCLALCLWGQLKISAVFCGQKVAFAAQERHTLIWKKSLIDMFLRNTQGTLSLLSTLSRLKNHDAKTSPCQALR